MKGIGKVFLGLIFLTLFSVGFNVSVKAAVDPAVSVDFGEDGKLHWEIGFDNRSFPDAPTDPEAQPATIKYEYDLVYPKGDPGSYSVTLSTDAGSVHSVKVGTESEEYDEDAGFEGELRSPMDLAAIKEKLDLSGDKPTGTFAIRKKGATEDEDSVTVTAYKVDLADNGGPDGIVYKDENDIEYSDDEMYLLPGQSAKVKVVSETIPTTVDADGQHNVYKAENWQRKGDAVSIDEKKSNDIVTVTMSGNDPGTGTVTAKFTTASMNIPGLTSTTEIKPGYSSGSLKIEMNPATAYSSNNLTGDGHVYVESNGKKTELTYNANPGWTWGPGGFEFILPETIEAYDEAKLILLMDDGNTFTRQFMIGEEPEPTGEYTVTVEVSPEDTGEATATNSTKKTDPGITIKADEGDDILLEADQDGYAFDKWTAVTEAGKKVSIVGSSKPEGASFTMPKDNVTVTAHFTGEDPGIVVNDPIEVTVGQGILLSHFTDVDDVDSVSGDGKYINSRVEKQSDGDYLVTGRASTEGKEVKDGITINGKSYTVLVHPRPTLITSDDIDEIIKSTIPVHVRYDDIDNKIESNYDVSYGTIGYKRDGEKYRVTTKYELSSKGSGRGTITLDWYDVSRDLKELYSTEKEEMDLELHSFPMNGSTADGNITDSNSEDLTVYRIKLLTSGGAKYKVNDKELDGTDPVFYAVEDADYEIKASAKDSSVGSLRYWEINGDRNDSTDETKEFTAERSRTYKAVYSTSSSSWNGGSSNYIYSSSNTLTGRTTATGGAGGSGGDYDDVPKTGESKTDIWILWSVLLVSILGAGFMIYKRFGLVRAIAEADREEAEAVHQEMVEKQEKEKENMISTLKGLRKL